MMLLGQLIQRILAAPDLDLDQLARTDPALPAQMRAAATAAGIPPAVYVREAVADLINGDDSETWTTLIGRIQSADDVGRVFVETAIRRRLQQDGDVTVKRQNSAEIGSVSWSGD